MPGFKTSIATLKFVSKNFLLLQSSEWHRRHTHLQNLQKGNRKTMSQSFPQPSQTGWFFTEHTLFSLLFSSSTTFLIWATWLHGKLNTDLWEIGGRHLHAKPYPWHKSFPCPPIYQLIYMKRVIQRRGSDKWTTLYPEGFSLVYGKYQHADIQLKPKCPEWKDKAQ